MHKYLGGLLTLLALAGSAGAQGVGVGVGLDDKKGGAAGPVFSMPGSPYAVYSTSKVVPAAIKSFQAIRASDSTTLDIGFVGAGADVTSFNTFCAGTTCTAKLYDQSGNGRDCAVVTGLALPQAIAKNGKIYWSIFDAGSTNATPVMCQTASAFTTSGDQTWGLGGAVVGTDRTAEVWGNFNGTNGTFLTFNGGGGGGIGPHPGVGTYFAATEYITATDLLTQQNALAFTRASGTATPYINGVAGTPTAGFSNANSADGATIGSFAYSQNFAASMVFTEAYYYTSALTAPQIASIQSHESAFWPDLGFGTPATGSASIQFSSNADGTVAGTSQVLNLTNILQYEYTQPWTTFVAAQVRSQPRTGGAMMLFANVTAPANPAFPGYEFWIDDHCRLRVRVINNVSTHFAGAIGTTQVCDLTKHVFGATYDGSGTAAGIKMYIDGNPETTSVEADTLGGLTIIATGQLFLIGNQQGQAFHFAGTMNVFRQDNIVRNAAYMLAHNTASSLLTGDVNTALLLPINTGSGTTITDTSGNGHNGTISSATMWVH